MKVLGFRFCTVSPEASNLASFLDALGFERHPLECEDAGAVFAAGESWLAMWPPSEQMRPGMMLQVVVDDADAFAAHARERGLNPAGPTDSKGKRIYFIQAPTGLQISIQSRIAEATQSVPAPSRAAAASRESVPVLSPPPPPVRSKSASPPALPGTAKSSPAQPANAKGPQVQVVVVPPEVARAPAKGRKGLPAPPAVVRPRTAPTPPPPGVRAMSIPVPPPGVFQRVSASDTRRPKS